METETASFCDDHHAASVLEFFLSLYKLQLEASESATSEIVPVESQADSPESIYELHVEHDEKKSSRRMTIATLGEGSGSKSKCFKVAYDNLIVVKIPPSSITSFREYITSIRAEGRIAVNLGPEIEYVAPRVTAILRKIHAFPDGEDLSSDQLEMKYVKWLVDNPEFQEYLKIGDSFVFFMDLSKNSFLSYVVDGIHDKKVFKQMVREEIMEARNLLWDILGFEGKYGSENLSICFDMNKVYSDYESKVRLLVKQHENFCSVSPYEKQKWFLDYLAQKEVKNQNNVSPEFVAELNLLLKKIMKKNKKGVSAYKKAVKKYIDKAIFVQNRVRMSGIITNIVSILASLKERGVAIRDLKPDNLFIVGDSERSAKDYSLGLIDFETAVKFKTTDPSDSSLIRIPQEKIEQPMLAGTPSYATPSHLFRNDVLTDVFEDLPRILYLQDWQAGIGMIYDVITGECLFKKTRKLLSKISAKAREAIRKKKSMTEVFKKSSRLFWTSAMNEFDKKMKTKRKLLMSVEVLIPENAREMLLHDIFWEKNSMDETIRKYVVSQVIFSGKKNRKNLIRSPLEKIVECRIKWEEGGLPETHPEVRKEIIRLLQGLESLKLQAEEQKRLIKILKRPSPKMTAYELLNLMFSVVLKSMYNEEWGELSDTDSGDKFDPFESVVLYEDTITYDA